MFRRVLLGIGASAAVSAALMLGAGTALAQHHGGGGGGSHGGGHAGGGHASVGHASVGHASGAWNGGSYHGGTAWRSGNNWGGRNGGYYGRHDWDRGRGGWYGGLGWGLWGYPYGGYGYWGYPYGRYGYAGYYPYYYSDYYPYYSSGLYAPDYDYGGVPDNTYSNYVTAVPDNTAQITVQVPDANAKVWFEGQLTSQRGRDREFMSPPLDVGRTYTYDIRAQWNQDGRMFDQTQHAQVTGGHQVLVNFTAAQSSTPASEFVPAPAPASR